MLISVAKHYNFYFQEEITEKVALVLEQTPLISKPIKSPLPLTKEILTTAIVIPKLVEEAPIITTEKEEEEMKQQNFYLQNLSLSQISALDSTKNKLQLDITPCISLPSQMKESQSKELFAPSPILDNRSIDSVTPDDNSYLGLSKINYDIDFSDISGDNSIADDMTPEKRKSATPSTTTPDPFSPMGAPCNVMQSPLIPSSAAFPTVHPQPIKKNDFVLPFLEDIENQSADETLIDKIEETPIISLPPPLKPLTAAEYMGFSKQGSKIPSIPCNTGDISSLSAIQSSSPSTSKEATQ